MLISDFQKSGWERQEEITLPEGAELTADLRGRRSRPRTVAVSSVKFQRDVVLRRGARDGHGRRHEPQRRSTVKDLPVKLEIDGRLSTRAM